MNLNEVDHMSLVAVWIGCILTYLWVTPTIFPPLAILFGLTFEIPLTGGFFL